MNIWLLAQIEELRRLMVAMAENHPLSDPQLVTISQKLDILLNQYSALAVEQQKVS